LNLAYNAYLSYLTLIIILNRLGNSRLHSGNFASALKHFTEGEKLAQEKEGEVYVGLNYGAGMCFYYQRKLKEAYAAFSYIVDKLDSEHAPAHFKAGECAHQLGMGLIFDLLF